MADGLTASHPGAILGVARFYYDPRGSVQALLDDRPGEARLLVYAMAAGAILLIGRVAQLLSAPGSAEDVAGNAAAQAATLIFFLPLVYYGLAALVTILARTFGGTGRWYEGRLATFWSALVSAPLMLLSTLLPLALGTAPTWLSFAAGQIGAVFFGWALAIGIAVCFGFSRIWPVLAVIAVLAMTPVALALLIWG